MPNNFDEILDECIDRINRGEPMDTCLADYPGQAEELRPLLLTVNHTKTAYSFTPEDAAKRANRLRFFAALEKRRQVPFWRRMLTQRMVWTTIVTAVVLLVAGYFGLRTAVSPAEPPSEIVSAPSAEGNFAFLVSDQVNALADFSNLFVTIDTVSMLNSSQPAKWIQFAPETNQFDLTLLPGSITQELWRGNVPEGNYTKVVIYVSKVEGTLKSTGEIIEIKLPSNKLQLSLPFQVNSNEITSFTYDLTVIHTGKGQGGQRYLLKPQISESGVSTKSVSQENPAATGQDKSQGKNSAASPDISNAASVNNNNKQK